MARLTLTGVALAGCGMAFWDTDVPALWARIRGVGLAFVLVLLPQAMWTWLHALGWQQILNGQGRRASATGLWRILVATDAARMVSPAGPAVGESLAVVLLRRRFEVPGAAAVASVAAKKMLIVLTNALLVALVLALAWPALGAASERLAGSTLLLWLFATSAGALAALAWTLAAGLGTQALVSRGRRLLARIPSRWLRSWLDARGAAAHDTDMELAATFERQRLRTMTAAGGCFFAHWLLEVAETLIILSLLGVPFGFSGAAAVEVSANLVRSLAFMLPAGLGAQDVAYVTMLDALGVANAVTIGAAFVVIKRAKDVFWIAIGGVLLLSVRFGAQAAHDDAPPSGITTVSS